MRSHTELIREISIRKALGLPRIELTPEEKARAYGDPKPRDLSEHDRFLAARYRQGLPMSHQDRARAKRFIRETSKE